MLFVYLSCYGFRGYLNIKHLVFPLAPVVHGMNMGGISAVLWSPKKRCRPRPKGYQSQWGKMQWRRQNLQRQIFKKEWGNVNKLCCTHRRNIHTQRAAILVCVCISFRYSIANQHLYTLQSDRHHKSGYVHHHGINLYPFCSPLTLFPSGNY